MGNVVKPAAAAALLALAFQAPAAWGQDDVRRYSQSGDWRVDDILGRCTLNSGDPTVAAIALLEPEGLPLSFMAIVPAGASTNNTTEEFVVDIDGHRFPVEPHEDTVLTISPISTEFENQFRRGAILRVMQDEAVIARFSLAGSAVGLKNLRKCQDTAVPPPFVPPLLPREPDFDGPFKPNQRLVALDPGRWVTNSDYRFDLVRGDMTGPVTFSVDVSAAGRVTKCEVTSSSGYPEMDDYTCQLVTRRARFQPATDGEGNLIAGTYSNTVRWQITQ